MSSTSFLERHLGPNRSDQKKMLVALGVPSLESLISQCIPDDIRYRLPLNIDDGISEEDALSELAELANKNTVAKSMIGQGYHNCYVPPVIQRNMFENPGWYTSYTPYQSEISQGRLEMLFHFQTLVTELTGLPIANASLLDEATAVAEAVSMAVRFHMSKRHKVVAANRLHPQTLDVLKTRGETIGFKVTDQEISDDTAAVIIQYPDTLGGLIDPADIVARAKEVHALVIVVADPLALTVLEAPANWGADIAVGSMQRFGVPMGNGGPHAAYMATTDILTRLMPGRLIGLSKDSEGNHAYRLSLQTREQHIRRHKATSNICTAQALLANMAAAYAIWHGPAGLSTIAQRVHGFAARFAASVEKSGLAGIDAPFFDTVTFDAAGEAQVLADKCEAAGVLVRVIDNAMISVAFDETTGENDYLEICDLLSLTPVEQAASPLAEIRDYETFLSQPIFNCCRSETDMMRLLRKMMDKDLALDRAMIPLGSCTMKLNAAAQMMPVSWPEFASIHPFAPASHRSGYDAMINDLDRWLSEITGFAKVSFQPNAGSQGEYAGLVAIRRFHQANGGKHRNICLIPSSAHGTNPATAHMAGMKVVVVKCNAGGDVDMDDLAAKAEKNAEHLAALMITYPSTHGVFEAGIRRICEIVHQNGGQVYLDGANLNAMMGLARLGDIGGDVCHMNLHKTFAIPHGGGGPGVGPIGVAAHLVPYLPGHLQNGTGHAVSAAPEGSASILPITWMFIRMLGGNGLKHSSEVAVLAGNYIARKLEGHYPVLFTGANGRVAHECIIDTRVFKATSGIEVEDIAKRMIDYGFHAPTMSWPVPGTLMIEPTESEPLQEIDRLVEALISIREEVARIEDGEWSREDNPLINAPHTAESLMVDDWQHVYSRKEAAYPSGVVADTKYWAPVARVDNVYGDRNLVCTCPPISELAG